jgi:class 3 adenylate cyclase
MPAAIRHDKIVVVFDLCSSSQIMEDLLLSDRFDCYETFLTCVKRWLMNWTEQHSQVKGHFQLYKFTGDGWILLFPATINGKALIHSMYSLCEMINAELARHVIPSLSSMPAVLGATLGVERGHLVRMMMNEREEYVGRALNVACRLQSAAKERVSHASDEGHVRWSCYKALVSAHLYNERLAHVNMPYKVESTTSSLRNILGTSGFACQKIDFTVDGAGRALSWPTHETHGWTCARSNWEGPP